MNVVYALRAPNGETRYIGMTGVLLCERKAKHIASAKAGSSYPVHVWIRELLAAGERPSIHTLFEGDRITERRTIEQYRRDGHRLLNVVDANWRDVVSPSEAARLIYLDDAEEAARIALANVRRDINAIRRAALKRARA